MKKINKNIFVFVLAFLFIGIGFSGEYFNAIKYRLTDLLFHDIKQNNPECLNTFVDDIDKLSAEKLRYHDELMDLNAIKLSVLNTRIIPKGNTLVVKTDGDSLVQPQELYSRDDISKVASIIQDFYHNVKDNGAEFLYIAVPPKGFGFELPENVSDYRKENLSYLVDDLNAYNVPTLDLAEIMEQEGLMHEDSYFLTDHHWKPEIGFWASGEICRALNEKYGFEYNKQYADLQNYSVKTYEDWFLGSLGKKVGRYYVASGLDDISLITPNFQTDLTELQPYKNQQRTGSFEDTVLYLENIETRNYHDLNPYATYSGGDFRLQIIKNNLNSEGKKIVIIRDSFACVVTPFLALNTAELHVVDIRNFIPTDPINVSEYINKIDPDYVLVLYGGFDNPAVSLEQFIFN